MGHKAEIGWIKIDAEGIKFDVFARRVGRDWKFFQQARKKSKWQEIAEPPLEDWLELLASMRRRIVRRLYQPDDEKRLLADIRSRFPEWKEE